MSSKKHSISFCTVCMNRSHHLKQTLPQNIADNADYPKLEFVLLDYNSQDGLEEWVRREMKPHIDSGRLLYVKTTAPQYFHMSHSRNVVCRAANGEIIVSVDADNFVGKGFAQYINEQFLQYEDIYLSSHWKRSLADVLGRICMKKEDFLAVHGYDERISEWGFEDFDLRARLRMSGLEPRYITRKYFLRSIAHNNEERVRNQWNYNELKELYIQYIDPQSSRVLFIYKDGTFEDGTLVINHERDGTGYVLPSILEGDWQAGVWTREGDQLELKWKRGTVESWQHQNAADTQHPCLVREGLCFYQILDQRVKSEVILKYSEIANHFRCVAKLQHQNPKVNPVGFGQASLTKNFSEVLEIK